MPSPERALALRGWSWAMIAVAVLSFAGGVAGATFTGSFNRTTEYFLVTQDAPVLLLLGSCLLVLRLPVSSNLAAPVLDWLERRHTFRFALIAALVVAAAAYAGSRLILHNFSLTADEFIAEFVAKIIATGRLLADVAPQWRDYVPALQPRFMLAVPGNAFWISSYLPMNSALRAIFVVLGDPAWEGAFLAGVAIMAQLGVARRLWPDRNDAVLVSIILLVCSSQFLFTAMTPYAMTAHLALNMVWLWLFLRDTRVGHVLAAGVAFVACGLHQVVFHPLFAAPFVLSLFIARRWKLAAWYSLAYASICLFWILYWSLLLRATSTQIALSADVGLAYFIQRIVDMTELGPDSLGLMGLNLLRFLAWQNPLVVPLAFVGLLAGRNRIVISLAAGIALTLALMLVLLPYQGHGWGYRYLHGFLGSFALIAAQGWICLTDRGAAATRRPGLALVASVVLSLVLLPWRAIQVRTFIKPYEAAVAAIAQSDADVVIVDAAAIWYGPDLVRNDPFLRASPKVMALPYLDRAQVEELCRRYDVAIFSREDAERFGLATVAGLPTPGGPSRVLRDAMTSLGCGRPLVSRHQFHAVH
jgi:hypothetical protein